MSMVKMSKFNLLAFDYDRSRLLKELQEFEYVHFNNLNDEKVQSVEEVSGNELLERVVPDT